MQWLFNNPIQAISSFLFKNGLRLADKWEKKMNKDKFKIYAFLIGIVLLAIAFSRIASSGNLD